MNEKLNQNEIAVANLALYQRRYIIALSAIVAALPKESINRQVVLKNISECQLFEGLVQKDVEAKASIEKIVDQILGPV